MLQDDGKRSRWAGLPWRVATYATIWWIIAEGDARSFWWGAVAVVFAERANPFVAGRRLRISLWGLLQFLPAFLGLTLRGAAEVAWRALSPRQPPPMTLLSYPWRLAPGHGRVFFANLINVMPGTLCVTDRNCGLTIHILGDTARVLAGLRRLEILVGRLFGEGLNRHG
ncbi:hypothetical protein CAI21_09995 [Alkalilimnicola ehrlichii]|uniref:Cation antiporter n=1 Tax=Alkalilimnicola ehrlichii TaxID=351052 RepID=A0A3E0WYB8_9GAMM|nr:Na+/H+ antiporter subunit E [Alkalilimnicola ehrlichii]RFA29384.1 hypothetical protein CAI21_09995 [Alkalilimnicola ehrlichii]RFA36897.1 hypothetical protein CAL65_10325 [Alkalilimnicola ehrlichii]